VATAVTTPASGVGFGAGEQARIGPADSPEVIQATAIQRGRERGVYICVILSGASIVTAGIRS
jgi:hypothetical protein